MKRGTFPDLRRWIPWLRPFAQLRVLLGIVATVALTIAGGFKLGPFLEARERHGKMADYCEKAQSTYLGYRDHLLNELDAFEHRHAPKRSLGFLAIAKPGQERSFAEGSAALNLQTAESYGRLKALYRKASRYPWVIVPEELEHPIWEEEMDPKPDGEY